MDQDLGTRVYVLGAGCSYDEQHGYPLAGKFIPALDTYAKKIAAQPDCTRIRTAVENTVTLLRKCESGPVHASTIDQLIDLIVRQFKCGLDRIQTPIEALVLDVAE